MFMCHIFSMGTQFVIDFLFYTLCVRSTTIQLTILNYKSQANNSSDVLTE